MMTELKKLRLAKGLRQNELALRAGIEPSLLSLIEAGKRPSIETALLLAVALGVSPGQIWENFGLFKNATHCLYGVRP